MSSPTAKVLELVMEMDVSQARQTRQIIDTRLRELGELPEPPTRRERT